jgi:hypothetical protein
MLINIPMQDKVTTREEPPKEIKGKGMPLVGKHPVTTAILKTA